MSINLETQIQTTFDALNVSIFPTDEQFEIGIKYGNMITNLEFLQGMLPAGFATNVQKVLDILKADNTQDAVSMNATRIHAGQTFVYYFRQYIKETPQSKKRKQDEAKLAEDEAKVAEDEAKVAKTSLGGRRMSYRSRKMKNHKKSKSHKKIRKGKRTKRRRY